jgi:hypothetical protein
MVTALARKFGVQVTSDLTLSGGWLALNGIADLDPEIAAGLEDASAYDTNGWSTSEITMQSWTLAATVFRRNNGSNVYDAGQELVRAAVGQFGTAARVGVRWYDKSGGPEAYSGVSVVSWKRTNTAVKNLEQAQITFTGTDVPLNLNISNPYVTALVPVVTSITPAGIGTGGAVTIQGANFTTLVSTTGVKFGGTNATSFSLLSDQQIVAVLPSGSAGTTSVVVTNATGAGAGFNYTRAA